MNRTRSRFQRNVRSVVLAFSLCNGCLHVAVTRDTGRKDHCTGESSDCPYRAQCYVSCYQPQSNQLRLYIESELSWQKGSLSSISLEIKYSKKDEVPFLNRNEEPHG